MAEEMPQNPPTQNDLLEQLLAGAAEREARKVTEEKLQKGTVTKAEFGTVLSEFEARLLEKFDAVLGEKLQKALPTQAEESEDEEEVKPVQKAGRRATLSTPTDARSDNPVRYLIQKGRKGDEYDDLDKALVWELTRKGFLLGMSTQETDGPDFADEYYQ